MKISMPPVKRPLVSIIVPTYNYGHYIAETLDSIIKQTYKNWECIVVDDGSTDNTHEIVKTYCLADDRVRYIFQENQHQAIAKNTGIKNIRGEYLQFLDADDLIELEKLEHQVTFLEENPHIDITYSGARYFTTEEPFARWFYQHPNDPRWMPEISGQGQHLIKAIINNNIMTINSPLLRRSVVADVGLFDDTLQLVEDWDYWIRCALKGKFMQYESWENSMALVRSYPTSISRNRKKGYGSSVLMRKKIEALIEDPEVLELNRTLLLELETWTKNIELSTDELKGIIAPDQLFILVDEDQVRTDLMYFKSLPFVERDGIYWGMPSNDEEAIQELQRLRASGALLIVFAWTAFWWLEYYEGWNWYLRSKFPCILENKRLVVFDLSKEMDKEQ
jgi:glycosyltransferase involved in cell wall biosynthesis